MDHLDLDRVGLWQEQLVVKNGFLEPRCAKVWSDTDSKASSDPTSSYSRSDSLCSRSSSTASAAAAVTPSQPPSTSLQQTRREDAKLATPKTSSGTASCTAAVRQSEASSSSSQQTRREDAELATPSGAHSPSGVDVQDVATLQCNGGPSCTPCHFVNAARGCRLGESCTFCHVHAFASHQRPSRAKRAKAKRLADGLEAQLKPEELKSVTSEMGNRRPYFLSIMRGKALQMNHDTTLLQEELEPYYPK